MQCKLAINLAHEDGGFERRVAWSPKFGNKLGVTTASFSKLLESEQVGNSFL